MNPTIKAQWIAALRSGDYLQGVGALHANGGYCCLGVLCDLHAKAGLGQWNGRYYGNRVDLLPEFVAEWADLSISPDVNDVQLVEFNDGTHGYTQRTFAQIADLIEEFL